MTVQSLYPPSPVNVPPEITRIDSAYRWRVIAMIGGLFLFLILYILLIAAAGALAYWLLVTPLPARANLLTLVLKYGGAFAAVLLWVFLFKGLFKRQRVERSLYMPVTKREQPELFAFIERVYKETGAPKPHRVYLSPEVNAALVYDTSLINLIIPPRRDLLIGLGLVNTVNLSEFKAVLAHEFGHFAQRSAGLGSYLYVANQIVHDIVYSRDSLDQFVEDWSQLDFRIAFPAWGLKAVLWITRKILAGVYQSLNLLHLSLSRQLEYNADNVAVSVTGSDALIHGLARLEFANACLHDAVNSLNAAADHGLFTDDIFYHQTQAAARLRQLMRNEQAGLPPALPADPQEKIQLFEAVDDGVPEKYRSHPTHYMREQNAKRIYIRSPQDDRSPWLLFNDTAALKQAASAIFYRVALRRSEPYRPVAAVEVQRFIDAEHSETSYAADYHGLFDGRFINPGDITALPDGPWPQEQIAEWLADWPPGNLQAKIEAHHARQEEFNLLQGLYTGRLQLQGKSFAFRGQQCSLEQAEPLLRLVGGELEDDLKWIHPLDRQMFLAHWSMAHHMEARNGREDKLAEELLTRYQFHGQVQALLGNLSDNWSHLSAIFNMLSQNGQLSEAEAAQLHSAVIQIYRALRDGLEAAKKQQSPALTNVAAGSSLHKLIINRNADPLAPMPGGELTGEWLGHLASHFDGVLQRLQRVYAKSMGGILAYQEKLAAEWRASM